MRGREGEENAGVSQSGTEPVCSQYGGPGESGDDRDDEDDALIRVKRVDQEFGCKDVGVLEWERDRVMCSSVPKNKRTIEKTYPDLNVIELHDLARTPPFELGGNCTGIIGFGDEGRYGITCVSRVISWVWQDEKIEMEVENIN